MKGIPRIKQSVHYHLTSSSHECWRHCPAVALNNGLYSSIGSKNSVNRWASSTAQLYLSMRTENIFQVFSLVICRRFPVRKIEKFSCMLKSFLKYLLTITSEILQPMLASHNQTRRNCSEQFNYMRQVIFIPWIVFSWVRVKKVIAGC